MQIDEGFTALPTEQLLRLKNVAESAERVLEANNEATIQYLRQDVGLLRSQPLIEIVGGDWPISGKEQAQRDANERSASCTCPEKLFDSGCAEPNESDCKLHSESGSA